MATTATPTQRATARTGSALAEPGWRVVRFAGEEVRANVERYVEEAIRLIRAHSSSAGD